MNIAEKMRELLKILNDDGVNDVTFPDAKPECDEDWSPDYAIIQDVYYDDFMMDDGTRHYFDSAELISDAKNLVQEHFAEDPSVVVGFYGQDCMGFGEIEVYRKTDESEVAQ